MLIQLDLDMLVLVPMVLTDSVPMDSLATTATSSANVKLKLMLIQLISITDTMVMPDTAMPVLVLMVPMVLTHMPLPTVAWLVWLSPHLTQPTPLPSTPPVSVYASTTLAHKFHANSKYSILPTEKNLSDHQFV